MRSTLHAVVLLSGLTGCSLSGFVSRDITDYRAANADAADRDLLLNVVRASKDEPPHFSEVSQIHGSVEANIGVDSSFPLGRNHDPYSVAPSISFKSAPSFDLGTLDTQDFWQGITTKPVDPATIKYALDNGLDERIAYLLFFSAIEDPNGIYVRGGGRRLNNDACPPAVSGRDAQCAYWWSYLGVMNSIQRQGLHLSGHFYSEAAPIGSPFQLNVTDGNVKDIAGIDASKYILADVGQSAKRLPLVQLYALLPLRRVAFCLRGANGPPTLLGFPSDSPPTVTYDANTICDTDRVIGVPNADAKDTHGKAPLLLSIRPVYGIVRYLGMVVRYQREFADQHACITLDDPGAGKHGTCDQNVLFRTDDPLAASPIKISYEGESYALKPARSCRQDGGCDNSVRVLGMLQLLLNLNKSAKDLPTTQTFRNIP